MTGIKKNLKQHGMEVCVSTIPSAIMMLIIVGVFMLWYALNALANFIGHVLLITSPISLLIGLILIILESICYFFKHGTIATITDVDMNPNYVSHKQLYLSFIRLFSKKKLFTGTISLGFFKAIRTYWWLLIPLLFSAIPILMIMITIPCAIMALINNAKYSLSEYIFYRNVLNNHTVNHSEVLKQSEQIMNGHKGLLIVINVVCLVLLIASVCFFALAGTTSILFSLFKLFIMIMIIFVFHQIAIATFNYSILKKFN